MPGDSRDPSKLSMIGFSKRLVKARSFVRSFAWPTAET